MLDIKFIRENKNLIKEAARKKRIKFDIEKLIIADEKRRTLIAETDGLRKTHREGSERIGPHSLLDEQENSAIIQQLKIGKDILANKEAELRGVESEFEKLMLMVPNIPDPSVPEGESDANNQEIRKWGEIRKDAIDYLTIMKNFFMVDLERGAKVSGFRGYFLKGDAVMLSMAMWQFTLDFLKTKDFTPFIAPVLIRRENLLGTGWFPQAEEDVYSVAGGSGFSDKTHENLYLSGTAEVPMMGYHKDEILRADDLPIKYVAFSPCFRKEAGSYGKDTKGIFRLHEFYKIEQIILCKADHLESVRLHEEITINSEEIMQNLQIPYRVVLNCGADLGLGQVKKYDIEGWIPSENRYRETHSSSYFHDFQARRLNIKYRDKEGGLHFVHSLNNTAIATPRIFEAFLENHAQHDGSIKIPSALIKYFGKEEIRPI